MWPFQNGVDSDDGNASAAANVLIGATEEATPSLLDTLVGKDADSQERPDIAPLALEVFAFGLHLTDRLAFARLGAHGRAKFMDKLLPAAQSGLAPDMAPYLEQLYNRRNAFYGGFVKLYPSKGEQIRGTVFWEFGKAMAGVYADSNPVSIMGATEFGMMFMQSLTVSYGATKVFSW